MNNLNLSLGDTVWKYCSVDILEFKVVGIRSYEGFNHYELRSKHSVGRHSRIEVLVTETDHELVLEEVLELGGYIPDESDRFGIDPYVAGNYHLNRDEAVLALYSDQLRLKKDRVTKMTSELSVATADLNKYEKLFNELKSRINTK